MPFVIANWRLLTIIAIFAVVGTYIVTLTMQRNNARARAENIQTAFDRFEAKVRVDGEEARVRSERQAARDNADKESADAEHARAVAGLIVTIKRLRDQRSPGGVVSAPAACPSSPAGADRFRAESVGAYRDLVEGLRGEGERSSKTVIDLNTGKAWAQK